ncbi:transposase [Candidatus Peregrinibacteria bacterium]|nr:transposase [Candidatus Peregrinibacteria bacterium]
MAQKHYAQVGTFHVTTNTRGKIPWCTFKGVPEILIQNLFNSRNIHEAKIFSFCILPNHMHILLETNEKDLSSFMKSFKRNAIRDIRTMLIRRRRLQSAPADINQIKWQRNFHDEFIRDTQQRNNALAYVSYNAWRHGMTGEMNDWPWSSVHYPHLLDPMEIWFS